MSSDKLGLMPASLSMAAEIGPSETSSTPVDGGSEAAVAAVAAKPRRVLVRKPKVVASAEPVPAQLDLTMPEVPTPTASEDAAPEARPGSPKAAARPRRLKLSPAAAPAVAAAPPEALAAVPQPSEAPVATAASNLVAEATVGPAQPERELAVPAPMPQASAPAPTLPQIAPAQPTSDAGVTVVQRIHPVALGRKRDALQHLLAQAPEQPTLIYTRTKHGADKIARVLERNGIKAAAIHGDKSQGARARAIAGFKAGELKALVITDIAARLLDFAGLPLVISYDLPHVVEDYAQRVARTGSAEAPGLAITLITQEESPQFRAVRDQLRYPLELVTLPGFEAAEAFDPERDPVIRPGADSEGAEAPAVAAAPVEARREGQGRGRRDRRGRQGRADAQPREPSAAPPATAAEPAATEAEETAEDAQPRTLGQARGPRPARNGRKQRPDRAARRERQPLDDRQPYFGPPQPSIPFDDDDDAPGPGNSLAAPAPSQLTGNGPGRRRGRRDPFAAVVVDENRANIYDERQPDDYRDQWSVLGPDTNRPFWTYAEHQPQSLDAPPPRRANPAPAGQRSGQGRPRGPKPGQPRGPQRHGRQRRAEGR